MSSMYVLHQSAEVQFVMFYWLHKTRIGGRSYSSTTDNLLNICTDKTKQHLQAQTYCHLLGLDETLNVAYNLGETQTFNFFWLQGLEILANVRLQEEN